MADAVTAAPNHYKVIEDNERVRILEFHGSPGDKTSMHSHPAVVATAITGASFRFTLANGETMEVTLSPGQAMYMDASDHATEVVGTSEGHVILVELK